MDETIDRLRRVNQRLHAQQQSATEIDAECAISPSFSGSLYQPWEQRPGHGGDRSATAGQPLPRVRSNEPA
jgi:hypothetical protein